MLDGIRCLVSIRYADCGDKRTINSMVISMSKGSHRRPTKEDIYQDNWDKIYTGRNTAQDKDKEKERLGMPTDDYFHHDYEDTSAVSEVIPDEDEEKQEE